MKRVEKVLVYVTRGNELLVFSHRDIAAAGLQVPAGTVESGESPAAAAKRELLEESGLWMAGEGRFLGRFEWVRADRDELHFRSVFQFQAGEEIPLEWLHTVKSSDEDAGMVFRFFWLPTKSAVEALAGDQGAYLSKL